MVFTVIDKARAQFKELDVRERSLIEHPELGPRYGVTAAPAIVINGKLEFRGIPREDAFRARLAMLLTADDR